MSRIASALLVAALVVLAGCAGGIAGPDTGNTGGSSADSGTVQFYVSDERNAISQFEHLNVTVTSVGFTQASATNTSGSAPAFEVEHESEGGLSVALDGDLAPGENATVEVTQDGAAAANVTAVVEAGDTEVTVVTDANGTATVPVPAGVDEFVVEAETTGNGTDGEAAASLSMEAEADGEYELAVGQIERNVTERTVDLTELQGANATALGNLSVPQGEYRTVFVHVSDVDGTLNSGGAANVKLPSGKLQLNEGVTVDGQSNVAFVFDITVFEAGNSGKYILKPVASESGTDVPITDVDEERSSGVELDVSVVGNATAGERATVRVTRGGDPVENATVAVSGDATVRTDANGTAAVPVPGDGELELEASYESGAAVVEGELELELGRSDGEQADDDRGDDGDDASTGTEASLGVVYEGTFAANETVTVFVTDDSGDPIEDATVAVDAEVMGETDGDGELTVALPADVSMASELTVTADGESVTVDASTVAAAN